MSLEDFIDIPTQKVELKTYNVIYKQTSTGATQQWQQEINPENLGQYRTVSGQVGGKLVYSEWKQCQPTNVGKANYRSPEQQAIFEVEANYRKKLERDYHETTDVSSGSKVFECMLAYEYTKRLEKKVSKAFPAMNYKGLYSQPKLNGMRCPHLQDGPWTRNGKKIVSIPHITETLKYLYQSYPEVVLDGELYNHRFRDDFNELMSIFKQLKPTEQDILKSREFGQYHLYDITVNSDVEYEFNGYTLNKNTPFSERITILEQMVKEINSPYIHFVTTTEVNSKEELDALYKEYAMNGYEGQMIRIANSVYENDRTWSLIKRKDFFDKEYTLKDILEGKGNWAGKAKAALLEREDGKEFKAGITGSMAFCEELLKNKHKYIGKPTTVNFQVLSPDGIPIFGRCKEFARMDV